MRQAFLPGHMTLLCTLRQGNPTGNSRQGTILSLWSAVIHGLPRSLPIFILSKQISPRFFSPHLKNYYATASCWDYTNKLIIAKQYAAPCSNITARQQSSPPCQLPFTACKQKRHKWRPPTLPASGEQSCWRCGPRVEFLSSLASAPCVQWGRAKSCSRAKQLSAIRMHHFLGVGWHPDGY